MRATFAAAVVAVALAACGTGAGNLRDETPVPPIVIGSDSDPTGFRGGVLVGIGLDWDNGNRSNDWRWNAMHTAEDPGTAQVMLATELLDSNCEQFPSHLPCPTQEETVLQLRLSGLSNLTQRVVFSDGDAWAESVVVSRSGGGLQEDWIEAQVTDFAVGTNCAIVAALEDEETVVGGQFADHSGAGIWIVDVDGAEPPNCDAPVYTGEWWPANAGGPFGSECALPWLTTQPEQYAAEIPQGLSEHWAVLPTCRQEAPAIAVFAINGILQDDDGAHAPFRIPETSAPAVVVPVEHTGGWLRVLIANIVLDGDGPFLRTSRPWHGG